MHKQQRKRLLVTGASGFLGWNICMLARSQWEVFAQTHTHPIHIPGCSMLSADIGDESQLTQLFEQAQPHGCIHAAALSQPNLCQLNPQRSLSINVEASQTIASHCARRGIALAFTSTDLVFNGTHAPYGEEDPVCPLSLYGEHKVMAEQAIARHHPQAAICRMPLMFGPAGPVGSSFLHPLVRALVQGEELKLFVDEFRTPISAATAAHGLLMALSSAHQGLLHLGGPQRISRYDFGLMLAELLGRPAALIQPIRQADLQMAAPRPADVSLDSSRAQQMGYAPHGLEVELKRALQAMEAL
jgi:dTDP-4-dehydrorhamnose reductase